MKNLKCLLIEANDKFTKTLNKKIQMAEVVFSSNGIVVKNRYGKIGKIS